MPLHIRWFFALIASLLAGGCGDVATPGWLPAERLEFSTHGDARGTRLAFNREGLGMVVWEQRSLNGHGRIHARAVDIGGAHGTIATLGEGSTSLNFPDVAINKPGRTVAVWIQGDGPRAQVWARTHQGASGWGPEQRVSGLAARPTARPRAAINDAGEIAVVWMQLGAGAPRVYGRHFHPTRGWGSPMRIDQSQRGAALPQVSVDDQGRWLATWHQNNPSGALEVWARQIDIGMDSDTTSPATQPHMISDGLGALPALTRLGDGSTAAVWQLNAGQTGAIRFNRFQREAGWGQPLTVANTHHALAHDPTVAAWGTEHAVVAWMQTEGDRIEVWAAQLMGGQPGTPHRMQHTQPGAQRQARIGAADHGNAVVMWTHQTGAARTLWASVWPSAGAPRKAEQVDNSELSTVAESALGVDARGHALAVWTQGEEGRARLWIRRFHTR